MSDLSRDARALIDAAHGADDPSDEDRARVHRRVVVQIGAAAAVTGAASSTAAAATAASAVGGSALVKGLLAAAFVASLGTAAVVADAPAPAGPARPAAIAVAAQAQKARTLASDARVNADGPTNAGAPTSGGAAISLAPAPPREGSRPPGGEPASAAARRTPDADADPDRAGAPQQGPGAASGARPGANTGGPPPTDATSRPGAAAAPDLGSEVALLGEAQRRLRSGDARGALDALDEHARRFGGGALGPEREAARILALCKLGRRDEARALADRFLASAPSSPLSQRVREACAR